MARRFTSTDVLTISTGSIPTARAGTWIVLFRPYDSAFDILTTNTDILTSLTGTSAVQALFLDSSKIFSNQDFGGGATAPSDKNTWYAMAFTKASGSAAVRYHLAAVGGAYTHTASGTVADGTAGITSFIFGKGPIKGAAKMDIAAAAVWTSALSDSAIDALGTTSMDTWLAASPVGAWQFNQASTGTNVNDLVGSANQTALTGTSVTTDPAGWSYHASTTPFTKDVVERYRVLNSVTKDVVERYRVTNAFTKDVVDTYRVLNSLTKDVIERYRVTNALVKDVVESYRVLNSLSKDVIERYRVTNALTKDVVETYRALAVWSKDVIERYTILSGTAFTKDMVERYRVFRAITVDVLERYNVGDRVALPADVIAYLNPVSFKAELLGPFTATAVLSPYTAVALLD